MHAIKVYAGKIVGHADVVSRYRRLPYGSVYGHGVAIRAEGVAENDYLRQISR